MTPAHVNNLLSTRIPVVAINLQNTAKQYRQTSININTHTQRHMCTHTHTHTILQGEYKTLKVVFHDFSGPFMCVFQ